MPTPTSETGDDMPTDATDATPPTDEIEKDVTTQSLEHGVTTQLLEHGDSPRQYTAPIGADAGEYNMEHEKRGRAIIFNHEKYREDLKLGDRRGTHVDKICLKQRLEKLKFDVEVYDDLSREGIRKKLYEVSKAGHKNADCLVVAVLTHGGDDKTLYAYDDGYTTDTLWSNFKANECPELAGKPKIFIIQACRGTKISEVLKFKSTIQKDSTPMNEDGIIHRYSIPVEADQLVAFSSYEGCASFRETDYGTWFIQEFCKELEENGEKLDLLTLFTNVNRHVAKRELDEKEYQNLKQMPVIQSTLTRKVFFSSAAKRSLITITPDVTRMLEKTTVKLDYIRDMLEDQGRSLSIPKVKSTRKQGLSGRWGSLQTSEQTMTNPVPQGETVIKRAEALKFFLEEEANKLEPLQKAYGEFILNFVSGWENLNEDMKWYGYKKLILFFHDYAKQWKWYKTLDIPDSSTVTGQQCHRYGSQTDVTDAGSSVRGSSAIVRRTSVTRKSYTRNKQ